LQVASGVGAKFKQIAYFSNQNMLQNDGYKEYYFWMFSVNKHNHQFEIAGSNMTNNPSNLKLFLQI